jgi:hypothetical protein
MPVPLSEERRDIPAELDEYIIDGCLSKDPDLRVSIEQFNRIIKYYAGDRRVQRLPKKRKRFPWLP